MRRQIGYCGLDKQQLGVGPEGGSLDISSYCAGYVTWDFYMMLLQVRQCTFSRTQLHGFDQSMTQPLIPPHVLAHLMTP